MLLEARFLRSFETQWSFANSFTTAMKPQEVTDALKLNQLKDKIWYVVPSCAVTGEGLLEGLVSFAPIFGPILQMLIYHRHGSQIT